MITYNLQFGKLCGLLHLGEILHPPEPVSGGFLHRMYTVETSRGKYAVKALNPQIMRRPNVMQNIITAERIASIAANIVPAIPARLLNGNILHEIDNQFYIIFDWVDGKSLTQNEIQIIHCDKIGSILAEIHAIDFSEADVREPIDSVKFIDWHFYMQKGLEKNVIWRELLAEHINDLSLWTDRAIQAAKQLASDRIISHRDLDPKNVLWTRGAPYLIDWESAGYINPAHELMDTAIYWATDENGNIDKEKFLAFVRAYKIKRPTPKDWRMALDNGLLGKLQWLEYSMKRSLWIECSDKEEQQMGTSQVTDTIRAIARYADMILLLEQWLKGSFDD